MRHFILDFNITFRKQNGERFVSDKRTIREMNSLISSVCILSMYASINFSSTDGSMCDKWNTCAVFRLRFFFSCDSFKTWFLFFTFQYFVSSFQLFGVLEFLSQKVLENNNDQRSSEKKLKRDLNLGTITSFMDIYKKMFVANCKEYFSIFNKFYSIDDWLIIIFTENVCNAQLTWCLWWNDLSMTFDLPRAKMWSKLKLFHSKFQNAEAINCFKEGKIKIK